jgi:lipopolysaccharide transport protein LptA
MRRLAGLLASVLLVAAAPAAAPEGPVDFRGDRLDARRDEGIVRLEGNVVVKHQDGVLEADRMVLHYGVDGKTVERIVASGNVRYAETSRRARATDAVYEPAVRRLVLTGSPRIWENGDMLAGSRIELLREPDRLIVDEARASVQPERLQGSLGDGAAKAATAPPAGAQP